MSHWITEFYNKETFEQKQVRYLNQLYDICHKKGLTLNKKEDIPWHETGIACFTIYQELKKHSEKSRKIT